MKQRQVFFGLLLVVLISNIAFSQGDYLQRGQNGIGLNFGFSSNSDASGIGGNISYSASGVVDISISITSVTFDDVDISAIAISPSLIFYAIKQEQGKFPISMAFGLGYERDSYSGDYLDQRDWEMNGNYFVFGFNIFGKINTNSLTTFQPFGSISHATGTTKVTDGLGNSDSEDDSTTSFGLGISMFFETSPKSIIRIDPRISFTEDYTTFSITLGVILPTK